jgi:glutathione-specific gamma-glutamylcyclotransferase
MMWVFGYGSLMWDDWEKEEFQGFQGKKSDLAKLENYHRDFNKSSVSARGTYEYPCPTLGLVEGIGAECIGSAFEFEDKYREAVLKYLRRREGPSFNLIEKDIVLANGRNVRAFIPVNDLTSDTYIGDKSIEERAKMAKAAKGRKGNCLDYINNIYDKLLSLGIKDAYVEQMWKALNKAITKPSSSS